MKVKIDITIKSVQNQPKIQFSFFKDIYIIYLNPKVRKFCECAIKTKKSHLNKQMILAIFCVTGTKRMFILLKEQKIDLIMLEK